MKLGVRSVMFVYGEVNSGDSLLAGHILANATALVSAHEVPAAEATNPVVKAVEPERCGLAVLNFMVCVAKFQRGGKHVQQCCQYLASVCMRNAAMSRSASIPLLMFLGR